MMIEIVAATNGVSQEPWTGFRVKPSQFSTRFLVEIFSFVARSNFHGERQARAVVISSSESRFGSTLVSG
jgi:hypothetical protein